MPLPKEVQFFKPVAAGYQGKEEFLELTTREATFMRKHDPKKAVTFSSSSGNGSTSYARDTQETRDLLQGAGFKQKKITFK